GGDGDHRAPALVPAQGGARAAPPLSVLRGSRRRIRLVRPDPLLLAPRRSADSGREVDAQVPLGASLPDARRALRHHLPALGPRVRYVSERPLPARVRDRDRGGNIAAAVAGRMFPAGLLSATAACAGARPS